MITTRAWEGGSKEHRAKQKWPCETHSVTYVPGLSTLSDLLCIEEVRRRAGIERELASRADQRVWRWFGHVERMDEYHMARRVLMTEVSG